MARKQTEVPGTERPRDAEVDAAACDVYELTSERLAVHEREMLARSHLLQLMERKGLTSYEYVDGEERYDVVLRETKKSVSVKVSRDKRKPVEVSE